MNIIADTPEVKPLLQFEEYSNSLVQILRTQHNISLGIFGDWGTGKTTLMKLIEAKLTRNVVDLMHIGPVDIVKILGFLERGYDLKWNEKDIDIDYEERLVRIKHKTEAKEVVFRITAEGEETKGKGKISRLLRTLKLVGKEIMEENEVIKNYLPGIKNVTLEIDGTEMSEFIAYADSNDRLILYFDLENDCIITCWFNPWKHETVEANVSAALLKQIAYSVVEHPAFSRLKPVLVEITKKFFGKLTEEVIYKAASYISTDPKKLIQGIQDEIYTLAFDSEKKSIYYEGGLILEKHIDRIRKVYPTCNIVVFIDDLDRCSIKTVLELFESIKAVIDLEGFSYVIGVSDTLIEQVLIEEYKRAGFSESRSRTLPKQYLNKVINTSFKLQDYSLASISSLLDYYLKGINDSEFDNQISGYREFIINSCNRNPRDLKRLVNFLRFYSPGFVESTKVSADVAIPIIIFFHSWNACYRKLASEEEFRAFFYNLLRLHAEDISLILQAKINLTTQANSQSYNPYYMFLSKIRDSFNMLDEESRSILISIPPALWVYFGRTRKTLKQIPWEELSPYLTKTDEENPRTAVIGSANMVQNLYESFERYYYVDKKYFSALRICNELINQEPRNPGYYNWRALPLLALGEFERAIEDYRKAFEIAKLPLYIINEAHTHYQFAAIDSSNKENHLLEAIECYKTAITIEPLSTIQMNYWVAESYNQLGDLQSSSKHYGEILKSNPNSTLALNGLGRIHLAKKEYTEAISKFNEILQGKISNMEKSSAYLNLATVYDYMFYDKGMDSKNITIAKGYLKIANELDPQNVEVVRYLEKLNQTFPYA